MLDEGGNNPAGFLEEALVIPQMIDTDAVEFVCLAVIQSEPYHVPNSR